MHLVGGAHQLCYHDSLPEVKFLSRDSLWLRNTENDYSTWTRLLQQTIAINVSSGPAAQQVFSASELNLNACFPERSGASGPPDLSFYAGTPLLAASGQNVGVLFVVDNAKSKLSPPEADYLASTARFFMYLLHLAQERTYYRNWKKMQEQLEVFIKPRSFPIQECEGLDCWAEKTVCSQNNDSGPHVTREESDTNDTPEQTNEEYVEESVQSNNAAHASTLKTNTGGNGPSPGNNETTYRNIFHRAAQCLQHALRADGVLFADGLLGLHGDVQPVLEPALELETEFDQSPRNEASDTARSSLFPQNRPDGHESTSSLSDQSAEKNQPQTNTRTYTSPEYRKKIYVSQPTEVLGFSGDKAQLNLLNVSKSIAGLPDIEEESFERMARSYPDGVVWYITDTAFMQVRDGIPSEIYNQEDGGKVRSAFPLAKQMLFRPITDPISTKLLGACFVWKNHSSPLFSEESDLASLTGFLHEVESEVARYDTTNMVRQRETFVASVSHELSKLPHFVFEYAIAGH